MKLSDHKWPEVSGADMAFPTFDTDKELLEESRNRNISKGVDKFNELFFSGGKITLRKDAKSGWKASAYLYAKCLMGSWSPKHEHKEAVCGMIFQEVLILD